MLSDVIAFYHCQYHTIPTTYSLSIKKAQTCSVYTRPAKSHSGTRGNILVKLPSISAGLLLGENF